MANTALDAINTLIEGVSIAQKRGAFSLEESAVIWNSIQTITNIQQEAQNQQEAPISQPAPTPAPEPVEPTSEEAVPVDEGDNNPE